MLIPKKIHYCWFGRKDKPKLVKKCISSWKKYCPDYEIIEWNEDNFDITLTPYTEFTYNKNLYAYLSDYVRLWAVNRYGGFYFDTDVEIIKPLDGLKDFEAFFGFETNEYITTGVGFGAISNHPAVKAMLDAYDQKSITDVSKEYDEFGCLTGSPKMNTRALLPYGLKQNGERQFICEADILPKDFLCPLNDVTGELTITQNTVAIHWYLKSLHGRYAVIKNKAMRPIRRVLKNVFHVKRWE